MSFKCVSCKIKKRNKNIKLSNYDGEKYKQLFGKTEKGKVCSNCYAVMEYFEKNNNLVILK